MRLTISNIQRKTNKQQEPLITFAINLHYEDRVLFTSKGWVAGVEGHVQAPKPWGFGGRRLTIFEVESEFSRSVRKLLEQSADVRAHLGQTRAVKDPDETLVKDLGERVEVVL